MAVLKKIFSDLEIFNINNIANDTEICNSTKMGKIDVVDFDREHFGIVLPRSVGLGMLVNLKGRIHVEKESFDFNATGKIEEVKKNIDESFYIKIGLNQYNADQWGAFLQAKESERNRVESIFKSMKGETS